ncbi:SEL1-like repeat protein [Bradyrhizobium manausense]|uniref:tetratricopeptide repeat protein n=1 Tax=Bradyrhizobium TaxID=374 RepID=UPI001BAC9378|nr:MULTISPECIES: tetratricopeptide repeat protein [Bradyrhizobium]MBR0826417.1 SEL1-like repeat protein [Bradyrhizobium manausense]UVO28823.1 SEL1-like repeat protein [Bradyrhizobium arachidis]
MNSRVSWSVDGIDPSVRERAEAAARRAGMSLNDWLNSTLGDTAPPNFRAPQENLQQNYQQNYQQQYQQPLPSQESRDVADIHQRLDAITRQIEHISKPAAPRADVSREQGVARQLNDAISRLDARLSQIAKPQGPARPAPVETRQRQAEAVERAAAQVYRNSPPLSPASLDVAVAEIAARQNELEGFVPRQMPPRAAPSIAPTAAHMAAPLAAPLAPPPAAYSPQPAHNPAPTHAPAPPPPPPGPDFSALERHLIKITSQIESLQRPDHIEQSIAAFRSELSEIRHAITEAMPRRAIESIENEIRSLHRRIDETRSTGTDGQVLSGIENALSEIKHVLRTLTPAEQLTGYDEAIRNLGAKLDLILRANDDPSTVQQLEGAISALRAIVSNVASNEALARLADDVQLLSSKVDQIGRASNHNGNSDNFAILEQRIAALTAALESRERPEPSQSTEHLEIAIRALSDRFDRMQVGNDSASTFAHLEQRVSYLLERIEAASDPHSGNLSRVEDGLHDILRHLERQQATYAALAESRTAAPQPDSGIVDLVKRELSDIRFSQSETNRSTQDSFEAVHNTLGHVVDRLAMIEGDLRAVRAAPPAAPAPQPHAFAPSMPLEQPPMARAAMTQQQPKYDPKPDLKPELPNPAVAQGAAQGAFVAAPREFHAATPAAPPPPPMPVAPPLPPRAISEILEPHTAPARAAIAPELPPDHPLEPGTRPGGRPATPSERIAASENAISEIPSAPKEPVSSSSFIAAARRAAQAAAAQPPEKQGRAAKATAAAGKDKGKDGPSTITSKIRSLLVGASVVVIVLGTFKMAMNLLEGGSTAPPLPPMENSSGAPAPQMQAPAEPAARPSAPEQITPSMTSPTPLGRQSLNNPPPASSDSSAQVAVPSAPAAAAPPQPAASDITGAIPTTTPSRAKLGQVQVPPTERLPDGIGGPALRAAAMKGDATAAYEIGLRFAEGKGIASNYDEAAKWYDRAAQAGVVPATFRLGTLYEKGLGVKKDADIARRYYTQAAERGNAKAMHNLAVLDADGGGRGANYKSAAQWFRKAADRGVADSQFNLGILYARGIGVEQNLAESYKWFSLAAAQGDSDASGKRDDVAKRLDPQSLAAAKLAIQTFSAEPQPDDAVNVATPAGGWDGAPAQASTKPAPKPVATKRSASAAH